jgi:DNA cross-link repair 1C protein
MFSAGLRTSGGVVSLDGMDFGRDENELPLTQMVKMMAQSISKKQQDGNSADTFKYNGQDLPKVITFPYSRHSSYEELCDLIRAFKPKDIYPCTVDEEGWNQGLLRRILLLFGDLLIIL